MKNLPPIKQDFEVKFTYNLHFTSNMFSSTNLLLKSIFESYKITAVKCLVVIDDGVANSHPNLENAINAYCNHHSKQIALQKIVVLPGGEKAKVDKDSVNKVLEAIDNYNICRHSFVIVIGGGALIDMVGFAAATAHRGVKLIRIPTTVLSQNDAAVGVKNGVNYFGKKNFLGSFATPYAIINDFSFLQTLEQRDWIAGIAEAVKVALIKDAEFFDFLEANAHKMADRQMEPMAQQIYRCAELHMNHIAKGGDPFESGSSRPLDFGHWAAHKLEQMTNYELRHGEAVAMGIALDVTYAYLLGLISEAILNRILNVLGQIGFNLQLPISSNTEIEELITGIEEFREHLGGQLTITLINAIGSKYDVNEIDISLMKKAIKIRQQALVIS